MKRIKIVGIAILVLSLCVILGITAWADASDVLTYSVTADKDGVCGGTEETVTLTVGIDKTDFVVSSIELWVTVPDGWVIESVTNEALEFDAGVNDKAGMFSWWDINASGVAINYVAEITVKIPADAANGDYSITVGKLEMVKILDDFTWQDVSIVPDEITQTIKVGHDTEQHAAKAPTCTEIGWDAYETCKRDGCSYTTYAKKDALGHTEGDEVIENSVAPKCTVDGSYDTVVYCTVCSEELSRTTTTVPKTGHTEGTPVEENRVEPKCTVDGSYDTVVYCTVCSEELSRTTTTVPKTGHTEVIDAAVAPDCTNTGLTEGKHCSVCNEVLVAQTVVAAKGHSYDAVVTDPTCTEKGYTTHTCSVCGDTYKDSETPAKGHDYDDGVVTTEPTCTEKGVKTFTCATCGDSYTEEVAALGHTEVIDAAKAPTCTETGLTEGKHCSVCGVATVPQDVVDIDKDNHTTIDTFIVNNGDGTHTVKHTCCNAAVETVAHVYDETTGLCECGDAKKFTFKIYGINGTSVICEAEIPCGTSIFAAIDKSEVATYYGEEFTLVKVMDNGEQINWSDDVIMPVANVEWQGYWSGWVIDETGAQYVKENMTKVGCWFEVDGDYYYADAVSAYVVTGAVRVPYPTVAIGGVVYAPDAEDVAYAASKGINFIDAEEAWFIFGDDGKFLNTVTGIDGGKYVKNGMIPWHAGLVKENGEIYYFVGDATNGGNMLANGDVWVTRVNGLADLKNGACYNFKDGQLSGQSGIVGDKYYENSELTFGKGLVKLNDNYIYVRSNGKVVKNASYYVSENSLGIVPGNYAFDANGYMISPNTSFKNGVVDGYYYVNGKVAYGAGLIKVDDDIYYVRSNGKVATGKYYVTNVNGLEGFTSGQKLYFADDGKLLPVKNGIVDGYYYINGSIAYGAGLIEVDGDIYYVRSNGEVATGKYYVTNVNDLEGFTSGQKLYFAEDGKLITD